jgi:hypothetical protein
MPLIPQPDNTARLIDANTKQSGAAHFEDFEKVIFT